MLQMCQKDLTFFGILQPKKAIQRSKFGAHALLPGMQDRFGVWCQDRHQICPCMGKPVWTIGKCRED